MNHDRAVVTQIIGAAEWFQHIPMHAVEKLAASAHVKSYTQNQYLYLLGEQTDHVYCILSGRVRVSISSSDGQEFVLTDLHRGAWFGEPALTGSNPRMQEVWVKEDSEILLISSGAVLKVAEAHPVCIKTCL